jgi:hypothetical protein
MSADADVIIDHLVGSLSAANLALARVRNLHARKPIRTACPQHGIETTVDDCGICWEPWPCATYRATSTEWEQIT